jgi:hypothetical protein
VDLRLRLGGLNLKLYLSPNSLSSDPTFYQDLEELTCTSSRSVAATPPQATQPPSKRTAGQ